MVRKIITKALILAYYQGNLTPGGSSRTLLKKEDLQKWHSADPQPKIFALCKPAIIYSQWL